MHDKLSDVFTQSQPLGPWAHENIDEDVSQKVLYDNVSPFKEVATEGRYVLLLGRKGSGKSAILADLRSGLRARRSGSVKRTAQYPVPEPRVSLVVEVESWRHFHDMVRMVASRFPGPESIIDGIPPEFYTEKWTEVLWDELFKHFFDIASSTPTDSPLHAVATYFTLQPDSVDPADKRARQLFLNAKAGVLHYLAEKEVDLFYLFDSMERYPIRNAVFSRVMSGFFQALVKLDAEASRIKVFFCLPEEIESHLIHLSAAVLKGFASSFRIRWRPVDLLRIIAHRYRLLAKIHDREWYRSIEDLDFAKRDDIHEFFRAVSPPQVTNRLGIAEDPLAYVIRHTQLLPRHAIVFFSAVISRSWLSSGGFRALNEDAFREGVNHVQRIVAKEVLDPYEQHYPQLLATCREVLPDLSPIASYSALRKIESRFRGRMEDDVTDLWALLYEIGILGRVVTAEEAGVSPDTHPERYCYGSFHFNSDTAFGFATGAEYCFHPAFTGAFGMVRPFGERRLVYPSNIDMITLDRR